MAMHTSTETTNHLTDCKMLAYKVVGQCRHPKNQLGHVEALHDHVNILAKGTQS